MFSIKQKQVFGVTTMVAVIVGTLGALHLLAVAGVRLEESRARAELVANSVYHQARSVVTSRDAAYDEIRSSPSVRAALEAAIYSPDVTDAAIVDTAGTIVASSDPGRIGQQVPERMSLNAVLASNGVERLRAVYAEGQTLEWTQPIELGNEPFGEIRVGLSTLLVRRDVNRALRPAALAVGISLAVAVLVALLLAQIVLRPILVIQSGLSRLGGGDLGATLDLRDEEFRNIGDVFERLSAQLRAAAASGAPKAPLAELSRRIVAIGRLTAGVAHEVKNPLNAMTIHLELLRQKLAAGGAGADAHAEIIGQEITRLDGVVQGFLKFARPDDVEMAPVDLAPLVASVADAVAPEAEAAGVAVQRECRGGGMVVEGDAGLLRQALLNLAQNAVLAMPSGGRLTISCARHGTGVEVKVADTGVGIAREHLAKIFDLYFTTKPQGTGIGLSLVYRTIALLHNGSVDVESVVGKGTTFTLTLPAAERS